MKLKNEVKEDGVALMAAALFVLFFLPLIVWSKIFDSSAGGKKTGKLLHKGVSRWL